MNRRKCLRCHEYLDPSRFYQSKGVPGAYPRCKNCVRFYNRLNYQRRVSKTLRRDLRSEEEREYQAPLLNANREALNHLVMRFKDKDTVIASTQIIGAIQPIIGGIKLLRAQDQAFIEIQTRDLSSFQRNLAYITVDEVVHFLTRNSIKIVILKEGDAA